MNAAGVVSIDVSSCPCSTLPHTLISHGLFPTAPTQPWMAISIELLSFFHAIFKCSCNMTHTLAAALSTYYARRGFRVTDHKVSDIHRLFILIPDCSMHKGHTVRDCHDCA